MSRSDQRESALSSGGDERQVQKEWWYSRFFDFVQSRFRRNRVDDRQERVEEKVGDDRLELPHSWQSTATPVVVLGRKCPECSVAADTRKRVSTIRSVSPVPYEDKSFKCRSWRTPTPGERIRLKSYPRKASKDFTLPKSWAQRNQKRAVMSPIESTTGGNTNGWTNRPLTKGTELASLCGKSEKSPLVMARRVDKPRAASLRGGWLVDVSRVDREVDPVHTKLDLSTRSMKPSSEKARNNQTKYPLFSGRQERHNREERSMRRKRNFDLELASGAISTRSADKNRCGPRIAEDSTIAVTGKCFRSSKSVPRAYNKENCLRALDNFYKANKEARREARIRRNQVQENSGQDMVKERQRNQSLFVPPWSSCDDRAVESPTKRTTVPTDWTSMIGAAMSRFTASLRDYERKLVKMGCDPIERKDAALRDKPIPLTGEEQLSIGKTINGSLPLSFTGRHERHRRPERTQSQKGDFDLKLASGAISTRSADKTRWCLTTPQDSTIADTGKGLYGFKSLPRAYKRKNCLKDLENRCQAIKQARREARNRNKVQGNSGQDMVRERQRNQSLSVPPWFSCYNGAMETRTEEAAVTTDWTSKIGAAMSKFTASIRKVGRIMAKMARDPIGRKDDVLPDQHVPTIKPLTEEEQLSIGKIINRSLPLFKCNGIKLLHPIGKGGQGLVIYAERHHKDKQIRKLAVKVCLRQDRNFGHELAIIRKLRHRNIIRLFDIGKSKTESIMVLEMAQADLTQWLKSSTMPSIETRRQWSRAIVNGLRHVHSCGIVHNDLKFSNILIVKDRKSGKLIPKICDFGLSKEAVREDGTLIKGHCGYGTAYFAPPECLSKEDVEDMRIADMWALGIIIYKLVTDRMAFPGFQKQDRKDPVKVRARIEVLWNHKLDRTRVPLSDFSVEDQSRFYKLVRGLLEPDPKKRVNSDLISKDEWFKENIPNDHFW